MLRTVEASIDEHGKVELSESVELEGRKRALVTILDEPPVEDETALLSEPALAEGWSGPEADEAWKHLADLPPLDEDES